MEFRQELISFLESFQILEKNEIELIAAHTVVKKFKKNTVLLREGAVSKACYSVIKGCVREYYIKDGVEKSTAFFTEGQPISSFTSYTNGIPSKHFLRCIEDSLLTVSNESLEKEICQKIPRLESIIRIEVEKNAGALQDRLSTFITSSPEERLLKLIEDQPSLLNRVPQHQIASYIGVTPESFSRIKTRIYTKLKTL